MDPIPPPQPRCRSPPIIVVILFAMFVSTGASILGGLVMYFESLGALEETVRVTSLSQVASLEGEVRGVLQNAHSVPEKMRRFAYSSEVLGQTPDHWADVMRQYSFAQLHAPRSSQALLSLGIVLIPHTNSTLSDALYSCAFSEPYGNGTRYYTYSGYTNTTKSTHFALQNGTTPPQPDKMLVDSITLGPEFGSKGEFLYSWNAASYLQESYSGHYDATHDVGLPGVGAWGAGQGTSRASRWRPVKAWYASDGAAYAYGSYDSIYAPPPPPHPWSGYRAVVIFSQFLIASWTDLVHDFSKTHPGTTIVLVNEASYVVYGSSTGEQMLNGNCLIRVNDLTPLACAMKVWNMSLVIQDAFHVLRKEAPGTFKKVGLAGKDHYVRKGRVSGDVVMLWVQASAVSDGQVKDALNLLIVFTVLVLVFDVVISLLEIYFVAIPLLGLSKTIEFVGHMKTGEAFTQLHKIQTRGVMILEIRKLMDGMCLTVSRLQEYKSFIPDAVLEESLSREELSAPSGEVAIVFTDVVASTGLWVSAPEAMCTAMTIHNRVMRTQLAAFNGYEVKTMGDAFMIVFNEVSEAVAFAMATQCSLRSQQWPEHLVGLPQCESIAGRQSLLFSGLRVRMGIHYGAVDLELNPVSLRHDYRGIAVNMAARVESQALPGMIAVSDVVKRKIGTDSSTHILQMGVKELKGLGECELFYILPEELRERETFFQKFSHSAEVTPLECPVLLITRIESLALSDESSAVSISSKRSVDNTCPSKPVFERQIRYEPCSFATVRMERVIETSLATGEPTSLMSVVNQTFQILSDHANMTDGRVEWFDGCALSFSWNCASKCASHAMQALRFCGLILQRHLEVNIGVASGPLFHGFIGSAVRKVHTVMGAGVQYSQMLCKYCMGVPPHALFVFAGGVSEDMAHCCSPLDVWEALKGYGSVAIVEQIKVNYCCELWNGWEGQLDFSPPEALMSLREAIVESVDDGSSEPLRRLLTAVGDTEEEDTSDRILYLLSKDTLATPCAALFEPFDNEADKKDDTPRRLCKSLLRGSATNRQKNPLSGKRG